MNFKPPLSRSVSSLGLILRLWVSRLVNNTGLNANRASWRPPPALSSPQRGAGVEIRRDSSGPGMPLMCGGLASGPGLGTAVYLRRQSVSLAEAPSPPSRTPTLDAQSQTYCVHRARLRSGPVSAAPKEERPQFTRPLRRWKRAA